MHRNETYPFAKQKPDEAFNMRITPSKVLNTFTGLVIIGLVYVIFSSNSFGANVQGGRGGSNFTKTCVVPKAHRDGLHRLTQLVHGILEGLDVTHFLCYGSLFGQIRQVQGPGYVESCFESYFLSLLPSNFCESICNSQYFTRLSCSTVPRYRPSKFHR